MRASSSGRNSRGTRRVGHARLEQAALQRCERLRGVLGDTGCAVARATGRGGARGRRRIASPSALAPAPAADLHDQHQHGNGKQRQRQHAPGQARGLRRRHVR